MALQGQRRASKLWCVTTTMPLTALFGLAAAAAAAEMDVSGCYRQDGSGNGFDKPVGGHKGHVYLQQRGRATAGLPPPAAVAGCIQQFCFSELDGDLTVTENGVGMLRLTRSGGNCTTANLTANETAVPALAFFLAVFPSGWNGEPTTGSFVNNWAGHTQAPGHSGWLTFNKTADDECRFMAHPGCMGPPSVEGVA